MKLEKLPSGSYRARQFVNGKSYSVTFKHKPTQKEVLQAMSAKMSEIPSNTDQKGSVSEWAIKYMNQCEKDGKSPSTVRGYYTIYRNTPDWFAQLNIQTVTSVQCQTLIKEYAQNHSPKSVRNLWSFYHSVLCQIREHNDFKVDLPSISEKYEYEPSTKDIEAIIKASEGTRYHIPFQLAVLGLRRGEVCALTLDDLDEDNILTITKDLVLDRNNNYVIKETAKTNASNRRILIPTALSEEIRKQGYIFKGNPHTLNEALHRFQDKLEIPRFRLHLMRHFAAAYLHQQGFTDAQILAYGGWENGSEVMKKVYRYNLDPEKSQVEIANRFDNLF